MTNALGLTNEEMIDVDRMSPGCLLERQIFWIDIDILQADTSRVCHVLKYLFQKIGTIFF